MKFPRHVLLLAATVAALCLCGTAEAKTIVLGPSLQEEPAPWGESWKPTTCISTGCAYSNGNQVLEGRPFSGQPAYSLGVIVRLNVVGATSPGNFRVRTLLDSYLYDDNFMTASPSIPIVPSTGVRTYPVSIPITGEEEVGLSMSQGASIGVGDRFGEFAAWSSDPPEHGSTHYDARSPGQVGFNVEIELSPRIGELTARSGPTAGGTWVTILGENFNDVSSVMFGGTPAASFVVESESKITAVSPPNPAVGPVGISVTTPAGASSGSPQFSYWQPSPPMGCVVPKLKEMRMRAVRKLLGEAECELGTVKRLRGASGKTGRVVGQSPSAGTIVHVGGTVSVTLKSPKPARKPKREKHPKRPRRSAARNAAATGSR